MNDFWNRPLADKGLKSYRYRGRYGWIMIGAHDVPDALREAARSTDSIKISNLEELDGTSYVSVKYVDLSSTKSE